MRRRLLICGLAIATGVAAVGFSTARSAPHAPKGSASALGVSIANAGQFPHRALIVSAPASSRLTAATLHVEENGSPVRDLSVTPVATASQGDFGVILAIDTSESMTGSPLRHAMAAARALAAERTSHGELGVIEFGHSVTTVLPLTSDAAAISAGLAHTPKTSFGTPMYSAALEGIRELHRHNIAAGTVIIVSDGGEYGTDVTRQAVASAAAADHVRVDTVGVKDALFAPTFLSALARATGGGYTASDAAGLRQVLTNIESQLTNRYVVRYDSSQAPGQGIQLTVWATGMPGAWRGVYRSPLLASGSPGASGTQPAASRSFWASTPALVVVSLAGALLLVGGLLVHVVPRAREHDLRHRIGQFTRTGSTAPPADTAGGEVGASHRADTWLAQFAWWPRFKQELSVAAIERSPLQVLSLTAVATLIVAMLFAVLAGTPLVILPLLLIGPVILRVAVRARAARQRRAFAEQLPGHLDEMGSAIRAGHSVAASIASVAADATDPARRELTDAVTDERMGVPLDAALRPIARRMRSADIDQLALVAMLNQRTGGNMAEVLDLIAAGARERADLQRELRALTAQARMSRWIVSGLPPTLLLALWVVDPSYLRPLFHTTAGVLALCVATVLVMLGSFAMRLLVPMED
jgi:tight adherence protein B